MLSLAEIPMKCYLNNGVLVTFPTNVSSQAQQDVLVSLLYAQLAADKSHQRVEDPLNWYGTFSYILENIGWTVSNADFQVDTSKNPTFVMASFALNEMAMSDVVLATKEEIEVFRQSFNVIHSLPDDDELVTLFYHSEYDKVSKAASLILASFQEVETEEVVLRIVVFNLDKNEEPSPRFLLHVYNSKSVNIDTVHTSKLVLNNATFSRVKGAIVEKLGERTETMVKELNFTTTD